MVPVVGIQERHVLALADSESVIARIPLTGILLVQIHDLLDTTVRMILHDETLNPFEVAGACLSKDLVLRALTIKLEANARPGNTIEGIAERHTRGLRPAHSTPHSPFWVD